MPTELDDVRVTPAIGGARLEVACLHGDGLRLFAERVRDHRETIRLHAFDSACLRATATLLRAGTELSDLPFVEERHRIGVAWGFEREGDEEQG